MLYRRAWQFSNALRRRLAPTKSRILFFASRSIILPLLIGGIAALVVSNSIRIRAVHAEEFGQNSLLEEVLRSSDEEYLAEESGSASLTTSYTGRIATVGTDDIGPDTQEDEDVLGTITEGGSAIARPDLTSSTPTQRVLDRIEKYVVQTGDTISQIAELFGISVNTILWENRLTPRDFIQPGDSLTILPTSGVTHMVQSKETLASIANKLHGDVATIVAFNKLASADDIREGQILVIPGGSPAETPRPVTPPSAVRARALASLGDIFGSKPPDAPARVGGMTWPTPSRRLNQYFTRRHTGVDIEGDMGSPIYAADDGRVIKATGPEWNGGYGRHIIIDHGNGLQTLYSHNSKNFIKVGDSVHKGQTIGLIGMTGRTTGPHVHFEVRSGGRRLNPLGYIK